MTTVLLDTDDLGEAEAVLSANYAKVRVELASRDTPTSMRIERTTVGSIGVDAADCSCDFAYDMEPPDLILLCRVVAGGLVAQLPQWQSALFQPGHVGAFGFDGLPCVGHARRGHYDLLVVEQRTFSDIAAGYPGNEEPVRLTGTRPVSTAANRHLFDSIEFVRRSAVSQYADDNPLIAGALERYVATMLLATLPSTALLDPTIQDRHDSTPVLLRRAMAFIDDNAHVDISLSDIAGAVYVTPRALQYMFRRHRDCTPVEYLRAVRLHHTHLDLVAGNRATTTVGEVARRWGFGHVGRFAVCYRQQYGQSPHVTLRD
jgi:AraC-like DNA-binding protein